MSFRNYYDSSSYGRSRVDRPVARTSSSCGTDKPTAVTAKYINPSSSSYKSSSIPVLSRERSATRENESPITAIANRYANYKSNKDDKPVSSKYSDKKDNYSKLTIPIATAIKSRDVSPASTSSKYNSLSRSSRHRSPERRIGTSTAYTKGRSRDPSPSDRDKDIPNKTDKSSGYNSLSTYKLYPRTTTSYTRPASRADTKPEITVNRYAIANRLSTNFLRSPSSDKSRTSVSPVNHVETLKSEREKEKTTNCIENNESHKEENNKHKPTEDFVLENGSQENDKNFEETITIVTRHTSPTPPGSSAYVRSRRAEMARVVEKTITRPIRKSEMVDKEMQSDRLDDPTRSSRFASTARASTTNWTMYPPSSNRYTGYAGRYSTQCVRDTGANNSLSDRNINRSSHAESPNKDNISLVKKNDDNRFKVSDTDIITENNPEIVTTYAERKDDDTPEIIINVNLKLKKAKQPISVTSSELVSPEITISNGQLPPQVPKPESSTKIKKVKVRKSSTDSSSDSSKKKVIKKRSKSVSSTDSDQGNDSNISDKSRESNSVSPPKLLSRNSSSGSLKNSSSKSKRISKSRDSNSPESSITLSTQSSFSEDETNSKSKTNEVSRTSVDEDSIPLDKLQKQNSERNDSGAEEAKSFLIRALAPVTNLFKIRQTDSSESNKWQENSNSESTSKDISNLLTESDRSSKSKITENIIASNDDNLVKLKGIRHIDSGERAWWMDPEPEKKSSSPASNKKSLTEKNLIIKIKHIDSGERAWWMGSNGDNTNEKQQASQTNSDSSKPLKKFNCASYDNEEKPWWLDNDANIPEGIERLTPPRKTSSDNEKSEKYDFYKVRHIESGEKDWWVSSNDNSLSNTKETASSSLSKSGSDQRSFPLRRIRHIESGERPWWLSSSSNIPEGVEKLPTPPPPPESESSSEYEAEVYAPPKPPHIPPFPLNLPYDEPLGDRRSPEGLETPQQNENFGGRDSPYENARQYTNVRSGNVYQKDKGAERFISRFTDIDDILCTCGQIYSPFMDNILTRRNGEVPFGNDMSECEEIDPTQVKIHDSTPQRPVIKKSRCRNENVGYHEENELDDAALQVFKSGDYGPYLDLESTLCEQEEELEGVQDSRKNAIVLRTQLSIRVHAIIERLLNSQGRELRRALFTLKQILQSDKDLVHEFVNNKGLDCLMQVSSMADHNYLDYILRALGQILLYVDGMHGVMAHKKCVQWLYNLIASKFRHVVKNALKLLLVFVEYTEKNSLLLIDAIQAVDSASGNEPWHNIMKILKDFDASDTELLIYATTLINRCLNNIPDRDTYYDQVDSLQDQGIDSIIQLYMSKQGTDLDLLRQLQIFDSVLLYEDGDENGTALKLLEESVVNSVRRRSLNLSTSDRRKSKKQQLKEKEEPLEPAESPSEPEIKPSPNYIRTQYLSPIKDTKDKELSVALKRRRDRFARQSNHIIQQQIYNNANCDLSNNMFGHINGNGDFAKVNGSNNGYTNGFSNGIQQENESSYINLKMKNLNISDVLVNENHRYTSNFKKRIGSLGLSPMEVARSQLQQKEELVKSPREIIKSPTVESKVSENDLHWDELKNNCFKRPLHLCDLDFEDLRYDTDDDVTSPAVNSAGVPPPPPPCLFNSFGAPPPPPGFLNQNISIPPPKPIVSEMSTDSDSSTIKKNKKTVKLFWREVKENPVPLALRDKIGGFMWNDLPEVNLDTKMLEHLFESRTNDLVIKKFQETKRNLILDAKRSNAINIAMKKLPTPETIKAAIIKMDVTVVGREGIDKLLTMLPTEEEKIKIQEAQSNNPDLPLGSAEQFLLTLASISELSSRLKLWVYKLDFDNSEKEIAEPLMDLKQGIELLKNNKTFKAILSTIRSVGCFLNGNQVKGFRLEYLAKVAEVKDTVHKHPLLYHVCEIIIEKFPDTTDFFSEVGPVIRASKVDFDMLSSNLMKLEADCKASWDHLKRVAKHDGSQIFKTKIKEFLKDSAERIILLGMIKKKVTNRYNKFLLYLGIPLQDLVKTRPSDFLKVIAEFALEYRTSRERVLLQLEKRANHRERNKTRGKLIIDTGHYATNGEISAEKALIELLKTDSENDNITKGRKKLIQNPTKLMKENSTADDEILESLVRSATTKTSRRPNAKKSKAIEKLNINGRERSPS